MIIYTRKKAVELIHKFANRNINTRDHFHTLDEIGNPYVMQTNPEFTFNWINISVQAGVLFHSEPQSYFGPYRKFEVRIYPTDPNRIIINIIQLQNYVKFIDQVNQAYVFHYVPIDVLTEWIKTQKYNGKRKQLHRIRRYERDFGTDISNL